MNVNLIIELTPDDFKILKIEIAGEGLVESKDIKDLQLPEETDFTKGVIISGKAPVWLYALLLHKLHISKRITTVDPRIGAVVVQSHDKNSPQAGDIIPFDRFKSYL